MANALLGLVSGVATNYISDELIRRLDTYKDKKSIQDFLEDLNSWTLEFETELDGTIASSGAFCGYVKNYHIVEQMVSYVLVPGDSGLTEQLFLEQQEQSMSRELEQRLERRLSPGDSHVIRKFLSSLMCQTKSFALRQTAPEDRALLYYLCQNNAGLSEIKQTIETMEKEFQCTREMIQDVWSRLESSQAESQPTLPEDETQLPEEFNALISKCNSALREAQRTVKVYSWDDLDFSSVYVLPALDFLIAPSYSSRSISDLMFFKDKPTVFGRMIDGSQCLINLNHKRANPILIDRSLLRCCLDEAEIEAAAAEFEDPDSPQARKAMIDNIFRFTDIVYIIGGAGYGKSLFLKNLCVSPPENMCSPENQMLIIRGDLKRMIRPDGSFKPMLEYLSECLTNGSLRSPEELPTDFLQRCIRAGRCLVLLDALDEVGNDQRNELHRLVITYFREHGAKNKVCITSRDRGFIPEKKICCLSIKPITEKDVREYVDRFIALGKFQESEKERFIGQAASLIDKGFVKGFLTLSLLLAIYKNEQELPANKVALYQKCFEYIANIREKNKRLLLNSSTGREYDWEMLAKLMGDATFMELAQLGTPSNRDVPRDAIDGLMTRLYSQRFHSETECREAVEVFLQFCADRTEVFVPSPNSNTEYRFFHRSFYEYFYASFIATRTRTVEDTYRKLDGFEVDSELFELLVELYNKINPTYLRELIEYAFRQAEEKLHNVDGGASSAFDTLVMLMQAADENDLSERLIRLFLDEGVLISEMHFKVSFDMIGAVFEKNQEFFLRYFEENRNKLLDLIAVDLSKHLIRNQSNYQKLLKNNHGVYPFFSRSWIAASCMFGFCGCCPIVWHCSSRYLKK